MVNIAAPVANLGANFTPITKPQRTASVEQGVKELNLFKERGDLAKIEKRMQEIGADALAGQQAAIDELALMPKGAKLAESLQTIANTREEAVLKKTKEYILDASKFAAGLLTEDEKYVRMALSKEAFKRKEAGDAEAGNELMRMAQLPDFNEIKFELRQDVAKAVPAEKLLDAAMGGLADTKKIREEVRSVVSKEVGAVTGKLSSIESNFAKIKNLASEIKPEKGQKANRMAVAQALISLVKLGDPNSAVLDGEMRAALNTENPLASMAKILQEGAGSDVIRALSAKIDPLDPQNVDIDQMLRTAKALIKAQVPSLQADYDGAYKKTNLLTQQGRDSIFTGDVEQRIIGLREILADGEQESTQGQQNSTPVEQVISTEVTSFGGIPIEQITSFEQVDVNEFSKASKSTQQKIINQLKAAQSGQ